MATHFSILRLPCGSAAKEYACNIGDLDSIPGLGISPREGKDYPVQYSCLENSMDCIVHVVTESDMTERLSLSLEKSIGEAVRRQGGGGVSWLRAGRRHC